MDSKQQKEIQEKMAGYRTLAKGRIDELVGTLQGIKEDFKVMEQKEVIVNGKKVICQLTKNGGCIFLHQNIEEGKATFDSFINLHS